MLTLASRITKGLTDRRSAPTVLLKSPRSRQTELTNHRSGGLGAGEPVAVLRRAREVSSLALCGARIGRPSGKCRIIKLRSRVKAYGCDVRPQCMLGPDQPWIIGNPRYLSEATPQEAHL